MGLGMTQEHARKRRHCQPPEATGRTLSDKVVFVA